jgi:hypothetical protein
MTVPAHLFRRAAAVLLFAAFVVAIVVTARLEGLASGSPKRRSDIVLQQAVSADMSAKQLRRFTRDIALSDPMHAVGFFLQVIALDMEEAPSFDSRRVLIAEASQRQPSFAAPRIWLTADDIRNERFARAINGADTVMRLNGEFRELLVPVLTPLLANDKAYPLLEKKLQDFPIWRTQFLAEAIKTGVDESRVEGLLRQNPPPRYAAAMAAERSVYLQNLVTRGDPLRARKVWQSFVPANAKAVVFDGDFTTKHPVLPFAWTYASDDYSYAEKVVEAGANAALVRAHHSGDGRITLVTQLVALKPGANLLTFEMRDGGLAKPENMFWRVRCMNGTDNLNSQPLAKLGGDWQKMQMQIDVPSDGCALQYLVLEAEDNDGDEAEVEIRKVEAR